MYPIEHEELRHKVVKAGALPNMAMTEQLKMTEDNIKVSDSTDAVRVLDKEQEKNIVLTSEDIQMNDVVCDVIRSGVMPEELQVEGDTIRGFIHNGRLITHNTMFEVMREITEKLNTHFNLHMNA